MNPDQLPAKSQRYTHIVACFPDECCTSDPKVQLCVLGPMEKLQLQSKDVLYIWGFGCVHLIEL
jgi:hypothetical protein